MRSANRQRKQAFGHAMIHSYQSCLSCGYPIRSGDDHPILRPLLLSTGWMAGFDLTASQTQVSYFV